MFKNFFTNLLGKLIEFAYKNPLKSSIIYGVTISVAFQIVANIKSPFILNGMYLFITLILIVLFSTISGVGSFKNKSKNTNNNSLTRNLLIITLYTRAINLLNLNNESLKYVFYLDDVNSDSINADFEFGEDLAKLTAEEAQTLLEGLSIRVENWLNNIEFIKSDETKSFKVHSTTTNSPDKLLKKDYSNKIILTSNIKSLKPK